MMDDYSQVKVDSAEGISMLMDWARSGGFVLNDYHRKIAVKHLVPVEGVRFANFMPIKWLSREEAEEMYPRP